MGTPTEDGSAEQAALDALGVKGTSGEPSIAKGLRQWWPSGPAFNSNIWAADPRVFRFPTIDLDQPGCA